MENMFYEFVNISKCTHICKRNIIDIKTYIAQNNPGCDTNMNMTNYNSQSFKHVIMGH